VKRENTLITQTPDSMDLQQYSNYNNQFAF